MTTPRRTFTAAEELALTTQVDGLCPRCGTNLFYKKGGRDFKKFDFAHIYPLNPLPTEFAELKGAPRLASDPNDSDNIIPLCKICHQIFDKPRTRAEYDELYQKKRDALQRMHQRSLHNVYPLEDEIRIIIGRLDAMQESEPPVELAYDPQRLDDKFDEALPYPTRRKIRNGVQDYFSFVRGEFLAIERENPSSSERIATQIKSFYLKQEGMNLPQHTIYQNIVGWLQAKTGGESRDAVEIVAAFFVQNCEVFR